MKTPSQKPIVSNRRSLLALFALLLSSSACSLLFDFTECATDSDCAAIDGPHACLASQCSPVDCLVDAHCLEGATCTGQTCSGPPGNNDAGSDVSDLGRDAGSDADATPDMSAGCTRNGECAQGELCLEAVCVTATTSECRKVVVPAEDPEDFVVFGSIISTSPPYDSIGVPMEQSIELAIRDFNAAQGLPGGKQIVWVSCDDRGVGALAKGAARHLTATLGAPAIVGPLLSTPFIEVVESVTADADVFTISPTASAPSITMLADNNLAWRVIASDVFQGNALADRVALLNPTDIAVFAKQDAYGTGLLGQSTQGLAAQASGNGGTLDISRYTDPADFSFDETQIIQEFASVIVSSVTAVPNAEVAVFIGTTETLQLAAAYVDYLVTQLGVAPQDLPRLVFSHGAVPALPDLVDQSAGALQPLVEGIAPSIFNPTNFQQYTLRFRLQFMDQDPITISTLSYDATLVALLAMSTVPTGSEITGSLVASGIARLTDSDGVPISFGDDDFVRQARNALAASANVDLRGVSGELDFDLATGDVRSDVFGWETELIGQAHQLKAVRKYTLDPPPATTGTWADL